MARRKGNSQKKQQGGRLAGRISAGDLPQRFQDQGFVQNRKNEIGFDRYGGGNPQQMQMLQRLINAGGQIAQGGNMGTTANFYNPATQYATGKGLVDMNTGMLQPYQGRGEQHLGSASAGDRRAISPERLAMLRGRVGNNPQRIGGGPSEWLDSPVQPQSGFDYDAFNAWQDPNIGGQQPGPIQAGWGGVGTLDTMTQTKMNNYLNQQAVGGPREQMMNQLGYYNQGNPYVPQVPRGYNRGMRDRGGGYSAPGIYQHQSTPAAMSQPGYTGPINQFGGFTGFTTVGDDLSAKYTPFAQNRTPPWGRSTDRGYNDGPAWAGNSPGGRQPGRRVGQQGGNFGSYMRTQVGNRVGARGGGGVTAPRRRRGNTYGQA